MMKSNLKSLLSEPYRLFFLGGSLSAVIAVGAWLTWLHLLDHGILWFDFREGPNQVHSHVMLFGVMGFYVFGFILTAFPRFIGAAAVPKATVVTWFILLLLSQTCFFLGATRGLAWTWLAGTMESAAYLSLTLYLLRLYIKSGKWREDPQPRFILLALGFGTLGTMLSYIYYAAGASFTFYALSIEMGTYGFLFLLVVSITYRIVPFFAGKVIEDYSGRRGAHTLTLVAVLITSRIFLLIFWDEIPKAYLISWLINLSLLATLALEWLRWRPWQAKRTPILFLLFLGLFWILVFLGFSGYELVSHLADPSAVIFPLLRTPSLHALYVGAFGTMVLAISTRVVRGHGGAPIKADAYTLLALLFLQAAAFWRVFGPLLWGASDSLWLRSYWAGLFWCIAFAIWAARYLPFLFRPKIEEIS